MPKFTLRPPTLMLLSPEQQSIELDRSLPRLYDAHSALNGIAIQAPAIDGGFSVQMGDAAVTGSKLGVVTGLASVRRVVCSLAASTPTNFTVTATPSKTVIGAIDIYVWQPTGTADTTPITATSAATVHWWAAGTSKLA